jgi:hypothetical protein
MDQPQLLWLVVALGAFLCGLFAGALLGGRPWVIAFVSAALSIVGFLVFLAWNVRPSQWFETFLLVSAFLPIPFGVMYGIGYAGGWLGRRIDQALK